MTNLEKLLKQNGFSLIKIDNYEDKVKRDIDYLTENLKELNLKIDDNEKKLKENSLELEKVEKELNDTEITWIRKQGLNNKLKNLKSSILSNNRNLKVLKNRLNELMSKIEKIEEDIEDLKTEVKEEDLIQEIKELMTSKEKFNDIDYIRESDFHIIS